eukprot:9472847-Pyramimonas_sp.AAC.1
MKKGKCADRRGVILEMFVHGGDDLHKALLEGTSGMLRDGALDPSWKETSFMLLPKTGNRRDMKNWRPIAILKIT